MRKIWILALVAVAAAIALALFWPDRGETGGGALAPPSPSAGAEVRAEAPLSSGGEASQVEARAAPVERAPVDVEPSGPTVAQDDEEPPQLVEGIVIVVEVDGTEHTGESGELVLVLHDPAGSRAERVEVEVGRFALECEPGTAFEVQRATLGARPALVDPDARRFQPEPGELVSVVLRRVPVTTLRVLDAATGLDLPRVTLLAELGWPADQREHPLGFRPEHVVVEGVPSPIELPAAEDLHAWSPVETWFAGAEGYAWGRVEVDRGAGGEQRVELVRGGDLAISIVGPRPEGGAALRVRRGTSLAGVPIVDLDPGVEERVLVPALVPGPHVVSLEQGLWFAGPRSLGEVRAEVQAGIETEVTLLIAAQPDLSPAPLAGTLSVGEGWDQERFLIVCELFDAPVAGQERDVRVLVDADDAVEEGARLYRWSVGDVQPGRWRVGVFQPPLDGAYDVPPEGLTDLALELPPAVEVVVRIVDADDGSDVPAGSVSWHPPFPERAFGGAAHAAIPDGDTGLWRIVAPRGTLEIGIGSPAHELLDHLVEADGDPTVRELRARQRMGFRVLLSCEGMTVPWPQGLILTASEVSGDGKALGFGRNSLGARAQTPRAGRWRVGGFEVPGYLPVPAFEIDVVAREFVAHEVQLERAP
jgi:hypothetical protein